MLGSIQKKYLLMTDPRPDNRLVEHIPEWRLSEEKQ